MSIRESFSDSLIKIDENEKQVLELIGKRQAQDLKPILIYNAIKSLSNNEDKESKEHLLKIKDITEEVERNIEKEVIRIRNLLNLSKGKEIKKVLEPYLFMK